MDQRPDFNNPWSPVNPADFVSVQVTDRGDGTEDVIWEYQPPITGTGFYKVVVIPTPPQSFDLQATTHHDGTTLSSYPD